MAASFMACMRQSGGRATGRARNICILNPGNHC